MLLGKNIACMAVMIMSSVFSWLFGTILFDIKTNSYLLLLCVFLSNGIFLAGFMTFLGNFVSTERAAGALSWSVLQILACFGGIMFPITIMPAWMVSMTNLNPLTWAVKALELALWKNVAFAEILLPLGIPFLAGTVFFSLSAYLFRWNSEK